MAENTSDRQTSEKQTGKTKSEKADVAARTGVADNLDVIKDIRVTLSMELGRASLTIRELLELDQGAVLELDRMVDEPMDIRVNGTLVARGEVVVVDDKFGVRLTDVVNPADRIGRGK